MMKSTYLPVLICSIGLLASTYTLIRQLTPVPELAIVPSSTIDLGIVKQDTTRTINFELKNRTQEKIAILDVALTCNCVNHTISNRLLGPGDVAALALTFESKKKRGSGKIGGVVAYRVGTEEQFRSVSLDATYEIDSEVRLTTEQLTFRPDQDGREILKVTGRNGSPLEIVDASASAVFIGLNLEKRKSGVLEVVFSSSEYLENPHDCTLNLQVNQQNREPELIALPITITRAGAPGAGGDQ